MVILQCKKLATAGRYSCTEVPNGRKVVHKKSTTKRKSKPLSEVKGRQDFMSQCLPKQRGCTGRGCAMRECVKRYKSGTKTNKPANIFEGLFR